MEDMVTRLEELEDKVMDLNVSIVAHKTMIHALLKFIEYKHGASTKDAISQGIAEAIEKNTIEGDTPAAISSQLLSEKLRDFL